MILKKIELHNFRNYESLMTRFYKGINIIYGDNAQGKTNAVEGIYIFARGKSFRAREDKDLIKFGEDGFRIYVEYEDKGGINSLEYAFFAKERRRKKNGYKIESVKEMIGNYGFVVLKRC